jgi:hypothetical protein
VNSGYVLKPADVLWVGSSESLASGRPISPFAAPFQAFAFYLGRSM